MRCDWLIVNELKYSDLQNILSELHDYHSVQQQWLRLQERLMWETASFDYEYEAVGPEILNTPKKVSIHKVWIKSIIFFKSLVLYILLNFNAAKDFQNYNLLGMSLSNFSDTKQN